MPRHAGRQAWVAHGRRWQKARAKERQGKVPKPCLSPEPPGPMYRINIMNEHRKGMGKGAAGKRREE